MTRPTSQSPRFEVLEQRQLMSKSAVLPLESMHFDLPLTVDSPRVLAANLNGDKVMDLVVYEEQFAGLNDDPERLYAATLDRATGKIVLGDVIFEGSVSFDPEADEFVPKSIRSFAAADFNGDGSTDVAVLYEGRLTVMLNDGKANFSKGPSVATTKLGRAVAGDFNGDGKMDLAVGGTAFFNDGNGKFNKHIAIGATVGGVSTAADFNGDGRADLALASSNGMSVEVWTSGANGKFSRSGSYAMHDTLWSIVTADVNGDGKLDIVAGGDKSVQVLSSRGGGTFRKPWVLDAHAADAISTSDLDGDGKTDIVACDGDAGDRILFGRLNGGEARTMSLNSRKFGRRPIVADFSGDKRPDVMDFDFVTGATVHFNVGLQATDPRIRDNSLTTARRLDSDSDPQRGVLGTADKVDVFELNSFPGGSWTFKLSELTGSVQIDLLDSTGKSIAHARGSAGRDSTLTATLAEDATYFVRIRAIGTAATGYLLTPVVPG